MKNYFNNLKIKIKNWTPFQKRYIPIFTSLALTFVLSIVLIFALPAINHNLLSNPNNKSSRSGWPTRLAAPYIDMSGWVDTTR